MAKVTVRNETGKLVMDFTYRNVRCREQTALPDTLQNRKRVEVVLEKIKKALKNGTFQYRDYFPESALASRFDPAAAIDVGKSIQSPVNSSSPHFQDFASQWFKEHEIEWRRSHIRSLRSTLDGRLIPHFGQKVVSSITKSDILAYRATLAKVKGRGDKEGLSP